MTTGIGVRVRTLREERGWSQRKLARELGMTRSAIQLIEAGGNPSAYTVLILCRVLRITPNALLGWEDAGWPENRPPI